MLHFQLPWLLDRQGACRQRHLHSRHVLTWLHVQHYIYNTWLCCGQICTVVIMLIRYENIYIISNMCEEDLSHIMSFRENMLLYTNAEQQIISTMKNYGLMSQVITETPKSNIARRDAEQLIDHRSICSGTLDETSLQSLGAGLPPNDFAQKTENLRRENTKDPNIASIYQWRCLDVSFPDVIRNSRERTKGNCSKHLQLPNAPPAHCIAFLRVPKCKAIHPQLAPALGNSSLPLTEGLRRKL